MKKNKKTKKRSSKNNSVTRVALGDYRVSIHSHPKKKMIGLNIVAPMNQAANEELMGSIVSKCVKYLVAEGFLPTRDEAKEQGLTLRVNAWGNK